MNMDVKYLHSPVALQITFSENLHPMRLQSAVYEAKGQAQDALQSLQSGAAPASAHLYCFVQTGGGEAAFYVGAYGVDTASEEEAWRWVTEVLATGTPEHMTPPRVMQTIQASRSSRSSRSPVAPLARA
jgi:hypothetical protein